MNCLKEQVNELLKELSFADNIEDDMKLRDDLDIDSLRLVEFITRLEDSFDIQFEMSDLNPSGLNIVADVYTLMGKYVSEKGNNKLYRWLSEAMVEYPQKTLSDEQDSITYEEILQFAKSFSSELTAQKYGVLCQSELNAAKATLACFSAGCTAVPLSFRYGETHTTHIIESMQLSYIITDKSGSPEVEQIASESLEPENLSNIALILCTSGTAGKPKGAMLTQDGIIANISGIEQYFCINSTDRILVSRPLYHCAVMMGEFLVSLRKGMDIVFSNREFNPSHLEELIHKKSISVLCGTPTLLYYLCRLTLRLKKPPALRIVAVSGECMTNAIAKLICEALPNVLVYNVYGLTEAGPRVSYLPPDLFNQHPTSVGIPVDGITVKTEDNELLVSGESIMRGYYNDIEGTNRVLADGWLHTGDIAEFVDGMITIKGRKDDMIIRAGMNIYPCEIEEAVKKDDRIEEAIAFGMLEGITQKIHLNVVSDKLFLPEIMHICRKELPPYAIPDVLEIVESIPRNASGKIIRTQND